MTKLSSSKKNPPKCDKNIKLKFEIGEKILCYQGQHIYEAKCINIRKSNSSVEYYIHYRGWKPKYDEWVQTERILKLNDENIQLQQRLRQSSKVKNSNRSDKNGSSASCSEDNGSTKANTSKKLNKKLLKKEKFKKSSENSVDNGVSSSANHNNYGHSSTKTKDIKVPVFIEKQEDFLNKHEVKIRIPEDLKTILTDDWDLVINQKKLVALPVILNIDKIFNDYFFHKSQITKLPSNHTLDGYVNFLSGIRIYFNYFLDKCLLYPSERQQLEHLVKNYDDFMKILKINSTDAANNKDSRRLWKKLKKSNSNTRNNNVDLANKLSTAISFKNNETEETDTAKTTKTKLPLGNSSDQNSQTSETSDSCTSQEVKAEFEDEKDRKTNCQIKSINDGKLIDFAKLYGAVHLLRLFTKMGQFLFYSDLNSERLNLLNSYIYDFLKYLSKNLWIFASESDTSYVDAHQWIDKTIATTKTIDHQ